MQQGTATRVALSIGYSLRGMLAQFARPGLVSDLAERMTADFARNLDRALSGGAAEGAASPASSLNGFALLGDILRQRLWRMFRRGTG